MYVEKFNVFKYLWLGKMLVLMVGNRDVVSYWESYKGDNWGWGSKNLVN